MKPFYPNTSVKVYRYTETGGYDDDGEPSYIYKYINTYNVHLEQKTQSDNPIESGTIQNNQYKLFTDITSDIKAEDIIIYDDRQFRVNGSPSYWDHINLLAHLEVELIELRQKIF